MKYIFIISVFLLSLSSTVMAEQKITNPAAGTPERKAILDGMRSAVESQLQSELVFVVNDIRATSLWAFVNAKPQRKDGKPIDGKKIFGDAWQHMDGLTTTAILKKDGGKWTLVQHVIGATDIWWAEYCEDKNKKIPKDILGVCPD
jgi:hypothetical protein